MALTSVRKLPKNQHDKQNRNFAEISNRRQDSDVLVLQEDVERAKTEGSLPSNVLGHMSYRVPLRSAPATKRTLEEPYAADNRWAAKAPRRGQRECRQDTATKGSFNSHGP